MIEVITSQQLLERLGWTLLHSLWQGLLLAACFWLVLRLVRTHSSAMKHMVALTALVVWLVVPVLTFVAQMPGETPRPLVSTGGSADVPPVAEAARSPLPGPTPEPQPRAAAEHPNTEAYGSAAGGWLSVVGNRLASVGVLAPPLERFLPFAALGWLVIATILAARFAGSLALVERWRRSGHGLPDIQVRAAALARRMGVGGPVRVATSSRVDTPTVIGGPNVAILLPPNTVNLLSDEELDLVLAHELAHVLRRDGLASMLQALVDAALYFHPFTHTLRRVLCLESELACDAAALEATGYAPVRLAEALTRLERGRRDGDRRVPTTALTVGGSSGQLATRVHRLLGLGAPRAPRHAALPFAAVAVLTLWLVTGTAQEAVATAPDLEARTAPASQLEAPTPQPVVVIDPGHGGGTGATGFVDEDEVVLAIGLKLAHLLEAHGVTVLMTRTDHALVGEAGIEAVTRRVTTAVESLRRRVEMAEASSLLVSLHAASGTSSVMSGITTWVPRADQSDSNARRERASVTAAEALHSRLIQATGANDRGIKANHYFVLENATVPAVLLELGFVTNEAEANLLATEEYQSTVATSLALGVLDFLGVQPLKE